MVLSTLFFHPRARVYNLRLLLLTDVVMVVMQGIVLPDAALHHQISWTMLDLGSVGTQSPVGLSTVLPGFICGIATGLHHILLTFNWPIRGLALIDLGMVCLELYVLIKSLAPFPSFVPEIIMITALFVSGIFRISTMVKTKESFYQQRLAFLGCCPQSDPHYTPLSILLNRSVARPLVRGESKVIIVARAFIISCVAVGVPAFGLYSIVIVPLNADVYTKSIVHSSVFGSAPQALTGNASISLEAFDWTVFSPDQINATGSVQNSPEFICTWAGDESNLTASIQCPTGWSEMYLMSISVAIPSGVGGLYATVAPWYSGEGYSLHNLEYNKHPIVLLPGSHLFGLLTWSARYLSPVDSSQPRTWVYIPEITSLQPNPNSEANASNVAQLTLRQLSSDPVQYFRDMSDSSALSGVSTLGGFWTFLNGAFVLLFGANVIYFAFGRRPLSALGVVHLFQRQSLSRQWNEDFPALRTEGGSPGSESAGIVAFIRERLVDVGDDPRTSNSMDAAEPDETETLHHQSHSDREESPVLDTQQDENWQRKEFSNGGTD